MLVVRGREPRYSHPVRATIFLLLILLVSPTLSGASEPEGSAAFQFTQPWAALAT